MQIFNPSGFSKKDPRSCQTNKDLIFTQASPIPNPKPTTSCIELPDEKLKVEVYVFKPTQQGCHHQPISPETHRLGGSSLRPTLTPKEAKQKKSKKKIHSRPPGCPKYTYDSGSSNHKQVVESLGYVPFGVWIFDTNIICFGGSKCVGFLIKRVFKGRA